MMDFQEEILYLQQILQIGGGLNRVDVFYHQHQDPCAQVEAFQFWYPEVHFLLTVDIEECQTNEFAFDSLHFPVVDTAVRMQYGEQVGAEKNV